MTSLEQPEMRTVKIIANGLTFDVARYGDPSGEAILLLVGLGSQRISWSDRFIDLLTSAGFQVVTMDNRDAGLSSKLGALGTPDLPRLRLEPKLDDVDVPYTIFDMADDVAGVITALGLGSVHVVGRSMGGLVAQAFAAQYPSLATSLTIIVSTSASSALRPLRPDIEDMLFTTGSTIDAIDRDAMLDEAIAASRLYSSPAFPFDVAQRRQLVAESLDRCHDPVATARQSAALLHAFMSDNFPVELSLPTLVVQGADDPIFPSEHGRDILRFARGARYLEIAGMGHDMEGGVLDILAREIVSLARE